MSRFILLARLAVALTGIALPIDDGLQAQSTRNRADLIQETNYRWPGWYVVGIGRDVHQGDLWLMDRGGPHWTQPECSAQLKDHFKDSQWRHYECWEVGGENGYDAYKRRDFKKAMQLWRQAGEAGDVGAQHNLGVGYATGTGVSQDYAMAFYWYGKAAAKGYAESQFGLGELYEKGLGTPNDLDEAARWYGEAAKQNHAKAQQALGWLHAMAKGATKEDYLEAVRLLRLSAAQRNAKAQEELGLMYFGGYGVTKDYAEAMRLFRLADAGGEVKAKDNIAVLYEHGYGVASDKAEALRWFQAAADKGDEFGAAAVKRLTNSK